MAISLSPDADRGSKVAGVSQANRNAPPCAFAIPLSPDSETVPTAAAAPAANTLRNSRRESSFAGAAFDFVTMLYSFTCKWKKSRLEMTAGHIVKRTARHRRSGLSQWRRQ